MTEYVIKVDGNDIIHMYRNGERLTKDEASQELVWFEQFVNTDQYQDGD